MNPTALPTIDPHHLGPLGDGPAPAGGAHELFAGEEDYLGTAARRKRVALWSQVGPRVAPLLQEGEQALYVTPAIRNPTLGEHLGLGWMALQYNQVALILTDRRMLEVQLTFGGKAPAESLRSFPWRAQQSAAMRLGKLQLKPSRGKKTTWSLRTRGDRKLLKQLVARIESQGLVRGEPLDSPLVHCPRCAKALPQRPTACPSCNVPFRSAKLAALLSLAFPGAGLLYTGNTVLAAFDFLGELLLFIVFGMALMTAGEPQAQLALGGIAAFFLVMTKLESMHVGHTMVRRVQVDTPERAVRFRTAAKVGAIVSVLALAAVPPLAGRLAPVVEQELDFSGATLWQGTREPSEWVDFQDDPALRSQWYHANGWMASVFSYALGAGESFQTFQRDVLASVERDGRQILQPAHAVPAPFEGFQVTQGFDSGSDHYAIVQYFIFDRDHNDVHQLLSVVPEQESEHAADEMSTLLLNGRWLR